MSRFAVGSRRWVRRYRAGLTVGSAVAVVVVAFAVLLLRGAGWLYGPSLRALTPDQQVTAIDDVRGRLIQLGAGLLALGALVYTARTFALSREGHVTDRYTKAIEQLGSEQLAVRVGAIYALERIMIDSRRDHPTIVEVLAAYVRESTPRPDPHDRDAEADRLAGYEDGSLPLPRAGADLDAVLRVRGPATDVQAALTVLGRRPSGRGERAKLDLRSTYLSGADLTGADLGGADLGGATLHYADLRDADLTGAHLVLATLTNAVLLRADLTRADLGGADLTHANLFGANLTRVQLVGTTLTDANLMDANLDSADLTSANLTSAILDGADLMGADLTSADLTDANLVGAYLNFAILTDADLLRANLTSANLRDAHLTRANLTSANLTSAVLLRADLTGAHLDDANLTDAVLPDGYPLPPSSDS